MGNVMRPAFRAAETRARLQPLRKAVQHAVHHQIRRTVAQIRHAQGNVAPSIRMLKTVVSCGVNDA